MDVYCLAPYVNSCGGGGSCAERIPTAHDRLVLKRSKNIQYCIRSHFGSSHFSLAPQVYTWWEMHVCHGFPSETTGAAAAAAAPSTRAAGSIVGNTSVYITFQHLRVFVRTPCFAGDADCEFYLQRIGFLCALAIGRDEDDFEALFMPFQARAASDLDGFRAVTASLT